MRSLLFVVLVAGAAMSSCRPPGGEKGGPSAVGSTTSTATSSAARAEASADGASVVVSERIPAAGFQTVILRARNAADAVVATASGSDVKVSGITRGGAEGYQSRDAEWKQTAAKDWGLGFKWRAFGEVLVISTWNEIEHIHHHYALEELRIELPAGIQLVRETRKLSGDGQADLAPPAPPASSK